MKALVYSVSRYDFEADGKSLRGTKVGVLEKTEDDNNRLGYLSMVLQSNDYELYDLFFQVPGIYDIEVKMLPGAKGIPRLVPVDAKLIREVTIQ